MLQQELEAMAGNTFNTDLDSTGSKPGPLSETMARWEKLFDLSDDQAVERIMDHRNNLARPHISDAHWDMIRSEKEAEGYDREACEYELGLQEKKAALLDLLPAAEDSSVTYLIEMNSPLDSPEEVQQAAEMETVPDVVSGYSVEESRPVRLCCVDGLAKTALLRWAAGEDGGFEPTILVNPQSLR